MSVLSGQRRGVGPPGPARVGLARLGALLAAAVERTNRLGGVGAGLILLAMVLMIGREAIGRYFFNAPTGWVVELSGFLLVGVVFIAGGFILQHDAHLRVDIFYVRMPRRARAAVDVLGYLLGIPYLSLLLWQGALLALRAFESGERTMIMRWPLYLPELLVPLGVALLLAQLLLQLVRMLRVLRAPARSER